MSPPRLKRGLKFFQGEEDFADRSCRGCVWLDVDGANLAAVLARAEVGSAAGMGVIEAEPGGARGEGDAAAAMRRDEGCAFFGGSVDVGRDGLAVPVELFRRIGVVVDVDGDLLAFFETQERAGKLAIVGGDGEDAVGGDLEGLVAMVRV